MAPKKGTKRTAAPHAEESDTKKVHASIKAHHVNISVYKTIVEALENPLLELNDECRKMLVSMVPHSLIVPVDERHEQQNVAVAMIEESILAVQAKLVAALEAENAKVSGSEAKKAELAAAHLAAEEALAAAKAVTADRAAAVKAATEVVHDAKKVKQAKLAEQKKGDASLLAAKKDKENLEGALSGPFHKLKSGDFEAAQAPGLFKSLSSHFSKLSIEESMKIALPSGLQKKPEDRGTFDTLVVNQVEEVFTKKIAELQEILAAGAPEQEERQKAVDAAQAAVEAAEATAAEATAKLAESEAAQQAAEAALEAAAAAVEGYESEYAEATAARDKLKEALETFQSTSVKNFNELKEKISKKKEREIAAQERAAAAAAAKEAAAAAAEEAAAAAAAEATEAAAAATEAAAAAEASTAAEPMEVEAEAPTGEGQ